MTNRIYAKQDFCHGPNLNQISITNQPWE